SPKNDPGVEKLTATKNLMFYLTKAEKLLENTKLETVNKLKNLVFAVNFGIDLDEDARPDLWRVSGEGEGKPAKESRVTLKLAEAITLEPSELYEIKLEAGINKGEYEADVIADGKVISSSKADEWEFVFPEELENKEAIITITVDKNGKLNLGKILLYKK
ncbi:MAG: hypothetical protein L5655_10505, partial [Thermosediminibacteraceae bacterium]|nr:hypothetical protein [Thermosediminibacteraceae bacterium]